MNLFNSKPKLSKEALVEIRELNRVVNAERLRANMIRGNTARIPNGKKLAEQSAALHELMAETLRNLVSQRQREAGVPVGQLTQLNLETGDITYISNES